VEGVRFRVPVPGRYNAANALAAIAVGRAFGVSLEDAAAALELFTPSALRSGRIEAAGAVLFNDSYNANPSSVDEAVSALRAAPGLKRRAVVLGDMLELGAASEAEHRSLGARIAEVRPNLFCGLGEAMRRAVEEASARGMRNAQHYASADELVRALAEWARGGDGILIKGSRGMRMEAVAEGLAEALRARGNREG
jgi:UDP-N-acetylmuramoyl-tripeptide--D-alanyl-D-alanine ligase